MSTIINLTRHPATNEQKEAGVIDLPEDKREVLVELLTFEEPPSDKEMKERARSILALAQKEKVRQPKDDPIEKAMIGGAPWFMVRLEYEMYGTGLDPVYAFSRRESVEVDAGDGVKKKTVFRHIGFVEENVVPMCRREYKSAEQFMGEWYG